MSATPPPIPQYQQQSVAQHQQPAWPPPQKKRPLWARLLLWGIAAPVIALIVIGVIGAALSPSPSGKTAPTEPTRTAPEPVFAHVDVMWQAYEDNEVKADQIYKGKPVAVVGIVDDISMTFLDSAVVQLRGDSPYHRIQANMKDSAKDAVANLRKGQQVTVRCEGRGKILGEPQLGACSVQ